MTPVALHDALRGVVAVLVTPYANGVADIDGAECTRIAARLDAAGIHALTALGNTAEVHQLDADEKHAVLRSVAAGRTDAALIAGLSGSSSAVLREAEAARDLGYDAIMLHEPADPFGDGGSLESYYRRIGDHAPLPVIVYLRSTRLSEADLAALVEHPSIVGVKYARPDLSTLASLLRRKIDASCTWVNGTAESSAPAFAGLGISGFTSGIAVARPDAALAVHDAIVNDNLHRLRELMTLIGPVEAIRAEGNSRFNVAVLKEMLRADGVEAGGVRLPHSPLSEQARATLHAALQLWPADMRG